MNTLGQIIANHRKAQKLSQGQVIEKLTELGFPIKKSGYSNWENGVTQPNAAQFLAICKILGITNIYNEFIGGHNPDDPMAELNDIGKAKVLEYIHLLMVSGEYQRTDHTAIRTVRSLKLFDMPVSAGPGNFLDSDNYQLITVGNEVPIKVDFGVRISGNSMEPQYLDKQIIWIQQTNTLSDGEIGIFLLNGNAYCKKYQNNSKGTALISLNPAYAPMPIRETDDFICFGRVLN